MPLYPSSEVVKRNDPLGIEGKGWRGTESPALSLLGHETLLLSVLADGVEVATDTQPNLAASSGNLQIGCGQSAAPATLWTGLIDDVRIYNRAVKP